MNDFFNSNNFLVFDIETIPDIEGWRKLHNLPPEMSAQDVYEHAVKIRTEENKSNPEFFPHFLQKIVCFSYVFRAANKFALGSLASPEFDEKTILQRFFKGVDTKPILISWNGSGFDLPVINLRSMIYGVSSQNFWNTKDDFKWNNYFSRYHFRHTDIMDVLALYGGRANAPLDDLSKLCGFPGKLGGMEGSQVFAAWLEGKSQHISNYCQTDVLNTYLMFLRFARFKSEINAEQEHNEHLFIKNELNKMIAKKPDDTMHLQEFLQEWKI